MSQAAPAEEKGPFLRRTLASLADLRRSPRELWVIYGVKFLESVAYFAIYNLLVVYLSEDLIYGDVGASSLAATWLTAISIATFFSGFIADSLGIRRAMLLSVTSCLLGRVLLAFSTTRPLALFGLFAMVWGVASMLPTMTAAVRQYTRKESVSFGFSLFYVVMNLGAFVAPLTIGYLRKHFAAGQALNLPGLGAVHFSSSRLMFLVATATTLLAFLLVAFLLRENPGQEPGTPPKKPENPVAILKDVVKERAFWRFMLFVTLLVFVKLIFQHAHLTWPKYSMRELGKDFPFATYWSINPLMIIFLTPVVTALTRRRSAFKSILFGSFVASASVLFMVAAPGMIWASVAFIVTLSLGEALYSPRLYEYTATIAPKGREASYMGLSQLPMFFAKPAAGVMSGFLLLEFCPETGPRQSWLLWAIVFATTVIGPILIVFLRGVIEPKASPAQQRIS